MRYDYPDRRRSARLCTIILTGDEARDYESVHCCGFEDGGTIHIECPPWIDRTQIDGLAGIRSIARYGCASGCYMPAVTYHTARNIMAEHGDDVLTFIGDHYGDLPPIRSDESWSGIAVHYLSIAVEVWAQMEGGS